VRTFSQINDTLAALTGVDPTGAAVVDRYTELRDSLPSTADPQAFNAAQQIAIHRLAKTYCGEVVGNSGMCTDFFGACEIDVAAKGQIADAVFDRVVGANLASQPARGEVTVELIKIIDDLGCANGCAGTEAELALQATCSATLSSAAVTLN
jgi:hypothetical protein